MYIIYRIIKYIALKLPTRLSYAIAYFIGSLYYILVKKDRLAVESNLKIILGPEKYSSKYPREVFINFSKYLIDFFRFENIDAEFIDKYVLVENTHYIDEALSRGHGVIAVTAHVGNWELAGVVTSMVGYKVNAVILQQKDARINRLFLDQRKSKGVKPILLNEGVKPCLKSLRDNELLAIVADRDFSQTGAAVDFFGKQIRIPRSPAILSLKCLAPILGGFLTRQTDGTFRLTFEKPIIPNPSAKVEVEIQRIIQEYCAVVKYYISKYPTQWYMFREFWSQDANKI